MTSQSTKSANHSAANRILSRDEALEVVKRIMKEEQVAYELVPFDQIKRTSNLRSERYKSFHVLYHLNTCRTAGWLVCRYLQNNGCNLRSAVLDFSASAGTGRLERHVKQHLNQQSVRLNVPRALPNTPKGLIASSAAMAVVLDLRPMSFMEDKAGMEKFVNAIFMAGQATPVSDTIAPRSLMPCGKTVSKALSDLVKEKRRDYKDILITYLLKVGGAVTTDGVTLKVKDQQFYDLTLHYIEMAPANRLNREPQAKMFARTILLQPKSGDGTAEGIRSLLNEGLEKYFSVSMDRLTTSFTMVTDMASVMARVARSSVSTRIDPMDQKWMGCLANQLNTAMKSCIGSLSDSEDLLTVYNDLHSAKAIVRNFKQSDWNCLLPNGFHLIQEVETRFATTFAVAERFIKSAVHIKRIISEKSSDSATGAFNSITKTGDGENLRFPALEALLDACQVIVEMQTRVQASASPTIHLALPSLQRCLDELDRIADGGSVWRNCEGGYVPSSRLSRKLCRSMIEWLEAKVRVHELWLAACFLHPFMREFQFIPSMEKRQEYKNRAETMVRALISDCCGEAFAVASDVSATEGGLIGNVNRSTVGNTEHYHTERPAVAGRKRTFSLLEYTDSHFRPTMTVDEVSRYNSMDVTLLGLNRKAFVNDEFAVPMFWFKHQGCYPKLYKVVIRLSAIPVSSCASERVFSALKRIVSADLANTSEKTMEEIIFLRSAINTV